MQLISPLAHFAEASKGLILRLGPTLRLLSNCKGDCGKRYTPQDACGADVELAANRLPAYFTRLADSAAQPVSSSASISAAQPAVAPDLMLPVASLATLKPVILTRQIRDIIKQGPLKDLVANFDRLCRQKSR